jgi:predicted transcriptional regulator
MSMMRFLKQSPLAQLGPLEQRMLRALWRRGNATVRELLDLGDIDLAYTTVMTTLDRLYKKSLLDRSVEGRAFRYSPRFSQQELERAAASESIRQLLGSIENSAVPLSYFVEAVTEHDAALLDDLQKLVEKKRRELRNGARNGKNLAMAQVAAEDEL